MRKPRAFDLSPTLVRPEMSLDCNISDVKTFFSPPSHSNSFAVIMIAINQYDSSHGTEMICPHIAVAESMSKTVWTHATKSIPVAERLLPCDWPRREALHSVVMEAI